MSASLPLGTAASYQCATCGKEYRARSRACQVCGGTDLRYVGPEPPPDEFRRVVLSSGRRRVRFWKESVFGRDAVRGIEGYESVSRSQARFIKDGTGWVIAPLAGASNPTRVNGAVLAVGKRYPLREGDILAVGRFQATIGFETEG
jgi:hypothetical protein